MLSVFLWLYMILRLLAGCMLAARFKLSSLVAVSVGGPREAWPGTPVYTSSPSWRWQSTAFLSFAARSFLLFLPYIVQPRPGKDHNKRSAALVPSPLFIDFTTNCTSEYIISPSAFLSIFGRQDSKLRLLRDYIGRLWLT